MIFNRSAEPEKNFLVVIDMNSSPTQDFPILGNKRKRFGIPWKNRPLAQSLILVIAAVALSACFSSKENAGLQENILKVGVLPDQSKASLIHQHKPLLDYLSQELDLRTELIFTASCDDLLLRVERGELDLIFFGGLTFVAAHKMGRVVPVAMRDIDFKFSSYFLVRTENPARVLLDLKGKKIGFGSSKSTSGHLMPRFFMKKMGIEPESFFSEVLFSGSHDRSAYLVRDGAVDVSVANSNVIDRMFSSGQLDPKSVRILWETPPYADYIWAARAGLSKKLRSRLLDAFLQLSRSNPAHRSILARQGAGSFLPASNDDFIQLIQIVDDLKLLEQRN